ncbi:dipeptide/oligopeptide ABC transporter substrate-binding protein [Arthrobacter crystallopoietes BAB-32]|uniref:Dipeptide/oligopeptide ABC transporter substrate-binding protein n=1 Tax=Arthrobacter crystallopoietes BAB-32 TaxID=1246476 RepID=N1UZ56_9MICC|nr:ABC transporter substrate-binding protein [Arthrobacter crystallopoietes]EMY33079.1 dipeptide/oligopeptide ABC transporter substrate-binding protein [Arthrobacter crystallopoietes BAB-32]
MSFPFRTPARGATTAAGAVAAVVLLAGCSAGGGSTNDGAEPVSGGNLVYATGDAEPTCLDPHVGGNYPQALISSQYLEPLVSKNSAGEIIPWLASSWEQSEDGLSWTFTLREGVQFTDGTPLDAEAVKANLEHVQDPATASSTGYLALRKIESAEALDEQTLKLTLSSPDSALLESFSMPWVAIQSPKALERSQEENCAAPVGTGPFMVEDWVKQESVTLVRNEEYVSPPSEATHSGPAYLDSITWRFIPESATRYAALQAGEVHVIDNAQPDTIKAAEGSDVIKHLDAPRPGASNRLELNTSKAPFDDPLVREAFIRSVNVNDGVSTLFFGTAARSYSPLSSVEPLAYSDSSQFGYDPEEANRLLGEAGWSERDSAGYRVKDGERLTLEFPVSTNQSIPAEQSLFEQFQATAKEAGFEVKLNLLDLSSWYGALAENDYNLVSAPYTKVGPDVLRILFHSDSTVPAPSGYFANLSQVKSEELDELLTRASETSEPAEREELYEQAQKIVLEGHYILPLYDQQNHFLYRSEVSGVRAWPTVSTPDFYDAWLNS